MNLEKMFQFPYEVFFVIWYDSVYHIQYIHLYMSAQYYFNKKVLRVRLFCTAQICMAGKML